MKKYLLPLLALLSFSGINAADNVTELTDATMLTKVYDYKNGKTVSSRPAVIDLWAPWCGPCRRLAPVVDSLAVEYDGRVDFYKVNVDNNPDISRAFRVQSIPMLLLIPTDGGRPRYIVGLHPSETLRTAIDDILLKK